MLLPRPRHEEFIRLRIAEKPHHRIFFHHLVQRRRQLILVGARLRFDRIRHRRLRHRHWFQKNLVRFIAQSVTRQGHAKLGHSSKIPRMQLLHLNRLAPLHDREMTQALRLLARKIHDRLVRLHHAANDLEERDPSRKRVRHRLVYIQRERLLITHFAHDDLVLNIHRSVSIAVLAHRLQNSVRGHWLPFRRRRRIHLQKIKKMISPHISQAAHVQHRKDPILANGLMQRANQVFLRNGPLAEELLHQFIFPLCHKLHQRLMRRLGIRLVGLGNRPHLTASIPIRLVQISLHGHQVHNSMEPVFIDDRQLHRHNLAPPLLLHQFDHPLTAHSAVRFGMIHLVDHDHTREVDLCRILPNPVGHRLNARLCIDNYRSDLGRQHRRPRLMHKHVKARRVDQVDLDAVPLRKRDRIRHCCPPRHIFFVISRNG